MTVRWPPASLTVRLAVLFAAAAFLTFAVVGSYLYRSLPGQLELRDDHELVGKIEQYRHILSELPSVQAIAANPHRLLDAAAGHDGLIVILRDPQGRVLLRTPPADMVIPDLPVVPAKQEPGMEALRTWHLDDARSARVVAAWGAVGNTGDTVQVVVARTNAERMALLSIYQHDVLCAMLAGALIAALLGYLVVQRALRPVRAIAWQAHSISAQRLDKRLDAHMAPIELQALVESFNAVLDRLQDSFVRLSQFSADLAHDLRTPVYNLTMQTEVALSQPRSVDEYQALLSSNLEEYQRVTRMVESMLFLARADNAQVALVKQPLDAVAELQRVVEYFEGVADEAGVRFSVAGSGTIEADAALFRRAVNNLVANAIRYTPAGQIIALAITQSGTETIISVTNPGTGIDPQHLPRLFDRFYRADQARSKSAFSTGLGLAIVQSIMKLHGGRAEVDSQPGALTTFRLVFPAAPAGRGAPASSAKSVSLGKLA